MTTLTVEIDRDKDLSALKEFIGQLGLKYEVEKTDRLLYTDEVKVMLDKRLADYENGKVELISAESSKRKIHDLLIEKNK